MNASSDLDDIPKLYGTFQNGFPQNAFHRTLGPLSVHEEIEIPWLSKFRMCCIVCPVYWKFTMFIKDSERYCWEGARETDHFSVFSKRVLQHTSIFTYTNKYPMEVVTCGRPMVNAGLDDELLEEHNAA